MFNQLLRFLRFRDRRSLEADIETIRIEVDPRTVEGIDAFFEEVREREIPTVVLIEVLNSLYDSIEEEEVAGYYVRRARNFLFSRDLEHLIGWDRS